MVKKTEKKTRVNDVITREYTVNLHKRLIGGLVVLHSYFICSLLKTRSSFARGINKILDAMSVLIDICAGLSASVLRALSLLSELSHRKRWEPLMCA